MNSFNNTRDPTDLLLLEDLLPHDAEINVQACIFLDVGHVVVVGIVGVLVAAAPSGDGSGGRTLTGNTHLIVASFSSFLAHFLLLSFRRSLG